MNEAALLLKITIREDSEKITPSVAVTLGRGGYAGFHLEGLALCGNAGCSLSIRTSRRKEVSGKLGNCTGTLFSFGEQRARN